MEVAFFRSQQQLKEAVVSQVLVVHQIPAAVAHQRIGPVDDPPQLSLDDEIDHLEDENLNIHPLLVLGVGRHIVHKLVELEVG